MWVHRTQVLASPVKKTFICSHTIGMLVPSLRREPINSHIQYTLFAHVSMSMYKCIHM